MCTSSLALGCCVQREMPTEVPKRYDERPWLAVLLCQRSLSFEFQVKPDKCVGGGGVIETRLSHIYMFLIKTSIGWLLIKLYTQPGTHQAGID